MGSFRNRKHSTRACRASTVDVAPAPLLGDCGREVVLNRPKLWEAVRNRLKRCILFSFEADLVGRVKARPADRNFRRARSRRAFTPDVILFIALPEAKDNIDPG